MTIGGSIRALRRKRGLTQAQLGALCGMTGGSISIYENGGAVPKRRVIERIARALEVPPEKITGGAPPPPPPREERVSGSDELLYDGVLSVLKELYGIVEGRTILGENGASRRYYVVKEIPGDFVLQDEDILAIVRSAKASISPLAAYMRQMRGKEAAL